ncbi:hypothetical protein [uncultured Sphingomonas sp.]|uniref:hypothetical protein n=1 Tax=uncultured Sphingomonas sp. TaxID=158754 RepID=UPI0030DD9DB9
MLSTKPLASLTSGLLARKGQARPAMRRQGASLTALSHAGEELGWNDMGTAPAAPEPLPLVLEERAQLQAALVVEEEEPATAPAAAPVVAAAPAPLPLPASGRKAAFTLRLDRERHLRLRLAAAVRGQSAQQLVTHALDALIATMPEVEALRAQLPDDGHQTIVRGD